MSEKFEMVSEGRDGWPWPFRVTPEPDELLSAYLCRVAHVHGATPYTFSRAYGGGKAFWARDVDRLLSRPGIDAIWSHARLPAATMHRMSLEPWIDRLTAAAASNRVSAVVPWINVVGVFHRSRRLHGLAYCAECLATSATFERHGRLAFVVACTQHRCAMQDCCPACDGPVQPHRGPNQLWRCSLCFADLRRTGPRLMTNDIPEAVRLQVELSRLLEVQDNDRSGLDLHAARQLAAAVVTARRRGGLSLGKSAEFGGTRIETGRVDARVAILSRVSGVIDGWPLAFRQLAEVGKLCYTDFVRREPLPEWLAVEVDRLPRRPGGRRPMTRTSMVDRVNALQRTAMPNWRGKRADLMIKAARLRRWQ